MIFRRAEEVPPGMCHCSCRCPNHTDHYYCADCEAERAASFMDLLLA